MERRRRTTWAWNIRIEKASQLHSEQSVGEEFISKLLSDDEKLLHRAPYASGDETFFGFSGKTHFCRTKIVEEQEERKIRACLAIY